VEGVRNTETQGRIARALKNGFQTRETEMALPRMFADLPAS
jgi:hypothetical protein